MKRKMTMFLALLAFLFLATNVLAMRSDNYWLDWYVNLTGGGGRPTSSTNYAANFTIGQTARGLSSSTNYQVGLGYWYGLGGFKIYLPLVLRNYNS